jgi:hypothetical protein
MPGWLPALIVGLPVAALVVFNLAFATSILGGYNAYLLDEKFLPAQTTTPSIAAIQEAGVASPSRVLMVGEAEIFDARFSLRYNTVFDRSLFELWFASSEPDVEAGHREFRPIPEIREQLREEGITHVFVNWMEIVRYRAPGSYGYTDFVAPDRFEALVEAGLLREVELPGSVMAWEDLDAQFQQVIQSWAPELQVANSRGFRRWVLYEVIAEIAGE